MSEMVITKRLACGTCFTMNEMAPDGGWFRLKSRFGMGGLTMRAFQLRRFSRGVMGLLVRSSCGIYSLPYGACVIHK